MFQQLKDLSLYEQAELLTRTLVKRESYNGTHGEKEKAEFIKDILVSFPYFQKHPDQVWVQEIENDGLERKNIFAFIQGKSKRTVLYHAHIDTVSTEDYGPLQEKAHDPDALRRFFQSYDGDEKVQKDAESGKWLFGRGALDMQSGIAVHLANALYYSEHPEELEGSLLLLFNPDEESQHAGMITALSELERLKMEENLTFLAAINNDFISPLYEGDCKRYIYTGAAGKILPCFHVFGRVAHVGDGLKAIDPTYITSEINRSINQNPRFMERIDGEFILPPSCLYHRDDKVSYNVQTPESSKIYFNYFMYEKTAKDVLKEMVQIAHGVCKDYGQMLLERNELFRNIHSLPERNLDINIEVVTLFEFMEKLKLEGRDVENTLETVLDETMGLDTRERAFKMVEALQQLDPDKNPRVVVFFAPPFLPHNYLNVENEFGTKTKKALEERLNRISEETGEEFVVKRFFPYLADGSFLSLHESDEDIDNLTKNIPMMDELYPLPISRIRNLNIPSINIGVYGEDGHKWTERLYMPYTFGVLPEVIREVTGSFWGMDVE
ncbi:M20/M25/M40 family metallo-hydrolase [Falsibacillus pallidus]|uniref:Arginine utilization protein RocB n=1 Tax=Falsibacillus pallidus TaxID=493781 RepID=A0A370GWU6_9BACI|nr:M20/M25/M40 family metallo-hydrolase [Falsibacillus pallidus]RDI47959.1 arginine utilization protein RocB [Falsibacillus pallidus]